MATFDFSNEDTTGVFGEPQGNPTPARGSLWTDQGMSHGNQHNQMGPYFNGVHARQPATSSSSTDVTPSNASYGYDNQHNRVGTHDWQPTTTTFLSTDATPSNGSYDSQHNQQSQTVPHYTQHSQVATPFSSTDVTPSNAAYNNQQNLLHYTQDWQAATATFSSTGVTSPSAGSYGTQTRTTFPPTNVTPPNAMPADSGFWNISDDMIKPNGMTVHGTFFDLYAAHPDLRSQIDAVHKGFMNVYNLTDTTDVDAGRGDNDFGALVESGESQESLEDPSQTLLNAIDQVNALPSQATSDIPKTKMARKPTTKMARSTATADASTVPHPQIGPSSNLATNFTQRDEAEEEAGIEQELEAETETGEDTNDVSETPAAAPRQPLATVPQYVPDIASIKDAHSIIDNPDPAICRKLNLSGDDVEEVKSQKMHFYAKKLFDAILTPGVQTPAGTVLTAEAQAKFDRQQGSLTKIQDLLKAKDQQKQARANCILAFEAAVFAHEVGVPKDLYDQFEKKGATAADRSTHLDATSICSERLDKMVDQVRHYKLVANDLLNGKRMHRLAWDPTYYSEQKIGYLLSNTTRGKTDNAKKLARQQGVADSKLSAKTGAASKRKRAVEAEPEQEAAVEERQDHEEDGDDQAEPTAKRAKQ